MPGVRNKDVQDWEGIRVEALRLLEGWVSVVIPSLSIVVTQFELLLPEALTDVRTKEQCLFCSRF